MAVDAVEVDEDVDMVAGALVLREDGFEVAWCACLPVESSLGESRGGWESKISAN